MSKDEEFKSLYQRYYWRVVRFYERTFRQTQEDAQDLAQEAFLRFYEAIDEYRGDAEWAFFETIARRVAYNRIRSLHTAKRSGNTVPIDDANPRHDPPAASEPDYATRQLDALQRKQLR